MDGLPSELVWSLRFKSYSPFPRAILSTKFPHKAQITIML